MSDIKDILGISRDASAEPRARPKKETMKKPVGMSREVFALLKKDGPAGESLTLAPTTAADGMLKEKRARMVGWEWKEFNNSARSDGLRLSHWGKNNDKSTDYTFARFNKTVRVLSYTDDEYTKHLTHPGWEKSESDELFDLCRRFDLRWPVIHDRFAGAKPDTPRPMEQLKERYYEMCKMLLNARAEQGEAEAAGHPLVKFKFDPRQEKERKAEFERLYHRSDQEVRAEVQRLEQAKALEAKVKMQKKMQKPGGRASGLAALKASLSAHGFGGGDDLAVGGLPSLAGLLDEPKKHRSQKLWLRSKDFSAKRPASEKLYSAFEQRMTELNVPLHPMPTERTVMLYNQCRAHVVLLTELESKNKKLEYERQVIEARKQQAITGVPPPPAPGDTSHRGESSHRSGGGGGGGSHKRSRPDGGGGGGSHKRSHH